MSLSSPAAKAFFASSQYAVVGASADPSKFGNKVLKWYQQHSLPVQPINPKAETLEGLSVIKSLEGLSAPSKTSISVIVPPRAAEGVIKSAKALDIPAVWLQPGCEDAAVYEAIKREGMEDRVLIGGPCILVSGESMMSSQSKL